jgi:hypothetical protein
MTLLLRPLPLVAAFAFACASAHAAPTLVGFAKLDANTFSDGPTSGQFVAPANGITPPFVRKQPVQGFSAVLDGPRQGTYYVMPDNGFGTKPNSPDALLRMYAVEPQFRTRRGGRGTVEPVSFDKGFETRTFHAASRITLRDPDRKLGFPIVADGTYYPYGGTGPGSATIPVDPAIRAGRLLTGADFDIESVREDRYGNLWFGEEFGPFLIKTDRTGKVLAREFPLAGVQSPQNPYLGAATPTLRGSNGFEGMGMNSAGTKLYPLLEGPLVADTNQKRLVISEFDIKTEAYTGRKWAYRLDALGTNIGDMTAVNDNEFLVIERNGTQGDPNRPETFPTPANFKKIYKIDLSKVDADGFVEKKEIVDLLNVADPDDLDRDGFKRFTFPFVTIEDVLIVDDRTLLVINDNNYPGNGGRTLTAPDGTEFILIRLDEALDTPIEADNGDGREDHRRHRPFRD